MRRLLVLGPAILVVLSGCAGTGTQTAAPTTTTPLTRDSGTLEGIVYDAEFTPLQGARVSVSDHPVTVTTDGRGAFTISDVHPGDHNIEATLAGYRSASQRVSVAAGEILSMRLELDAIPTIEVYPELVQYTGHMTVGLATVLYAIRPGTELEDELEFRRDVNPGAKTLVATMTFTRTSPAGAEKFQLDSILGEILYNQTYGESPLLNRVDDVPVGTVEASHSIWLPRTCDYFILATCYGDPPSSVFQFALDQRFDVYSTLFYGGEAPAEYTGLPD